MLAEANRHCKLTESPSPPDITKFDIVCHTGGPSVLKEVAQAIGVTADHLASSWEVMRARGNLSGASNLAVLDQQNARGGREWVVCLSMGPGACLEGLVLLRVQPLQQPQ